MSSAKNTNKTRMAQRTQKTKEMEEEKIKNEKELFQQCHQTFFFKFLCPKHTQTRKKNLTK
jgi:phage anti-repressor protein